MANKEQSIKDKIESLVLTTLINALEWQAQTPEAVYTTDYNGMGQSLIQDALDEWLKGRDDKRLNDEEYRAFSNALKKAAELLRKGLI